MWIALVCLYGFLKGIRDIIKKKAMEKNTAMEVLFFYTLVSFLFVTPDIKNAVSIDFHYIGFIMVKSLIIFIAWICSFRAIKRIPIGFYGIMDMSRVIFASALGVLVLSEVLTRNKIIGMAMVLAGLLLVNLVKSSNGEKVKPVFIVLILISCLGNALSELLDKMLMQHMNSGQLQFWYMFFLVVLYLCYLFISRTKIRWRSLFKNYWVWILSILFVIGDKALFIACASENSTVVAMTLIKQCSVLITIMGGRIVFKEERTAYKLMCAGIIITGIVLAVI